MTLWNQCARNQNCYAQLCELDEDSIKNIEIAAMEAGLGGGFDHTSKLKVMKFKEALNQPDSNEWDEEIENEYTIIVMNGV